jgi:hypothetical protein
MTERDRERELARIAEEIDRHANWLIQGRCGDDSECADAKRALIAALQAKRERLLAGEEA